MQNANKGTAVKRAFTILIADRNRHIREFLKREMLAEGYQPQLAKNGSEVLKWIENKMPPDLLILDLDLPGLSELDIVGTLQTRVPTLPVVVHTILSDFVHYPPLLSNAVMVEKNGNSIDRLKKVVSEILRNFKAHCVIHRDDQETECN